YIMLPHTFFFFSFNDPATPEISTLSLHDALPIFTIHYPEHSLVNRHNRAMAAQMLASAARFGITGKAMLTGRKDDVREARKRRRSEEHTSELQSRFDLVCRLLLEKKKNTIITHRQ